jgi:hypothetical protein
MSSILTKFEQQIFFFKKLKKKKKNKEMSKPWALAYTLFLQTMSSPLKLFSFVCTNWVLL